MFLLIVISNRILSDAHGSYILIGCWFVICDTHFCDFARSYPTVTNSFLRTRYKFANANSVKNCNAFLSNPL